MFAPLCLNGGIPQGTKLGPELFAVMVNDLVESWVARIKFVDDLTSRFWRLHLAILHPFSMYLLMISTLSLLTTICA